MSFDLARPAAHCVLCSLQADQLICFSVRQLVNEAFSWVMKEWIKEERPFVDMDSGCTSLRPVPRQGLQPEAPL